MRGQDSHETMKDRPFSGHRHRRGKASRQRRSRAVDRSRERHGWSIGVRVRPHRAPHGASLPVGRSVFESGRPETGGYPLTVGVEDFRLAVLGQSLLQRFDAEMGPHRDRNTMRQHPPAEHVDDRRQVDEAASPSPRLDRPARSSTRAASRGRSCGRARVCSCSDSGRSPKSPSASSGWLHGAARTIRPRG